MKKSAEGKAPKLPSFREENIKLELWTRNKSQRIKLKKLTSAKKKYTT